MDSTEVPSGLADQRDLFGHNSRRRIITDGSVGIVCEIFGDSEPASKCIKRQLAYLRTYLYHTSLVA